MLESLYIRNFVLISELTIDFHEGFTAFTGETGAGKSILMDAISLLCGERASAAQIRAGQDKAIVEGTFSVTGPLKEALSELGFEDDEVTVTREFDRSGKNTCRLNRRVITLSNLKDTIGRFVDIHSQREHQYLLNQKYHRVLLDTFAADQKELDAVAKAYKAWRDTLKDLDEFQNRSYSVEREEILRYQLKEITDMKLVKGEDEELEQKIRVMSSYEKIFQALSRSIEKLDGDDGALSRIYDARKDMGSFTGIQDFEEISASLSDQYYELADALERMKDYLSNMEMDEGELDRMNGRLFRINALKRKYGSSIEEILAKKESIEEELESFSNREEVLSKLTAAEEKAHGVYNEAAEKLHDLRMIRSKKLERAVVKELKDLQLPNARFTVAVEPAEPSKNGSDEICFMISMNPGEPERPIQKAASGGELSRLMLGLKTVFTALWGSELIIFDEIDSGVSGSVALSIGKKMRDIGVHSQVFSVTHLAPVAACAARQYKVAKHTEKGQTFTEIRPLSDKQRLEELALINTGEITETAVKAAEELLKRAKEA